MNLSFSALPVLAVALFAPALAQTTSIPQPITPPPPAQAAGPDSAPSAASVSADKKLTDQQRKQLAKDVHEILEFASTDTGLPIRHEVKMRLISRDQVERDLQKKLKEDKGEQHMERAEIVLKKFGLIDPSFNLQPFMVSLLKEQIAGFYDDKKKNITLLDWIEPEDQRSVLAHELTHALQDQYIDLTKFEKGPDEDKPSPDAREDNVRLAVDERDTSREAVAEGQAMIPLLDYQLRPQGLSVAKTPQVVDVAAQNMNPTADSPLMFRAPLLLQESLTFPYREGLVFESAVLQSRGQKGAFQGTLDAPPEVSAQILHPQMYLDGTRIPAAHMPDVHPLLDAKYAPYDLGAMGEFDVKIFLDLFSSEEISRELTPQWAGGVYYASQRRSDLNTPTKDQPSSIALLYFSEWKTAEAAKKFAAAYRGSLSRKYNKLTPRAAVRDAAGDSASNAFTETSYDSDQGYVVVGVSGTSVFTSEGYTPEEAHALEAMFATTSTVGAQTAGVTRLPELTAGLRGFFSHAGIMRAGLITAYSGR